VRRSLRLLRRRWSELEPLERSFSLGSRLFVAVLPLSLVAQQLTIRDTSLGELLTAAFRLEGAGRATAETLFAPPAELGAGLGLFAILVLLLALRGFARGIQRLYTDLWYVRLPGPIAIAWQFIWATWLVLYVVADITLAGIRVDGEGLAWVTIVGSLALYVLMWAITPMLLLARRVPFRRMAPTIVLTAVAIAVFDAVSRLYFPSIATENAERYGLIGFAFSLLGWFFINQTVVVTSALLGAVLDELRQPRQEPTALVSGSVPGTADA
jgi:membrane protein